MDLTTMSQALNALQEGENGGRGVSSVRTICFYLGRGERSSAEAAVNNEWDKIRSYPAIVSFLKDNGLAPRHWV